MLLRNWRIMARIFRSMGADKALAVYGIVFVVIAALIWRVDPAVPTFRASLWYCFVAGTTIGFGDIAATTPLGRGLTVVISTYSIIMVAVITAVITNFFLERAKLQARESVHAFMDELERLPELSREDLVRLSEQIKAFRRNGGKK